MEGLMDRLNIDMHEACLKIDKECRFAMDKIVLFQFAYVYLFVYLLSLASPCRRAAVSPLLNIVPC